MVVGGTGMLLETVLSLVEWEVYKGLREHVIIPDPRMEVNTAKEMHSKLSPVTGCAVQVCAYTILCKHIAQPREHDLVYK